ncbi:MAG TPA: HNH endonuclease signature motif containing protein [Acidimicrobiia bacterium]
MARDRHCTWPGCRRSARWCDVHHIVSWAEGGETVITNLCLLCRYHHTLTHLQHAFENDQISANLVGAGRRRST